jgi:type I restriction enzyme, R subunit
MSGILDQAVERFKERGEDEREQAKTLLVNFRNTGNPLSGLHPGAGLHLRPFPSDQLPRRDSGAAFHLEDEVELQYYRLQEISERQISLSIGNGKPLKRPSDVGTGQEDTEIKLSELIDILNERFVPISPKPTNSFSTRFRKKRSRVRG